MVSFHIVLFQGRKNKNRKKKERKETKHNPYTILPSIHLHGLNFRFES